MRQFGKFVCVDCRRSFKRPFGKYVTPRPCPVCGKPAIEVHQKFKPPRASDNEQWEKVRLLILHGFRFNTLHDENNVGADVRYPETLRQARQWVKKWAHKAEGKAMTLTETREWAEKREREERQRARVKKAEREKRRLERVKKG